MTGFPLYLLGLVLVGLWWAARPRLGLGTLTLIWGLGLLVVRLVLPIGLGLQPEPGTGVQRPAFSAMGEVLAWIGSLLILRALLGFTTWGPARRGWFTWFRSIALGLTFLLNGIWPETGGALAFFAIPWLWSFRWRVNLGAGALILGSVVALLSFLLGLIRVGDLGQETQVLPGFRAISAQVGVLSVLYAFLSLFATAGRIHLSIRRIGRRLIGSHLLAGTVPFALAILFLLLAGALFLSTYRGSIAARLLVRESHVAETRLRASLQGAGGIDPSPFGLETPGQILMMRAEGAPAQISGGSLPFSADSLLDEEVSSREAPLLWDGGTLYLRARVDTVLAGRTVRWEALAPVDSLRMIRISDLIGSPVRINPHTRVVAMGDKIAIGTGRKEEGAEETDTRAIGPGKVRSRDLPGGAIASCLHPVGGGAWEVTMIAISSSAGLGEPVLALILVTRENPLAWVVLLVLGVIALFFLGAIWVAIGMVFQMARSIARAVHALTKATAELGWGNLEHRIEISGKDELWDVAASFNEMAEGLERMRAVERETQRLEEEMRLAQEIQTRLLPSSAPRLDRLELAGVSLPARQIGGDYFDYLLLGGGLVGIAVADVSGKGAPAALLMSSFRASLRTQDLARLGPAEVLARLNRFIHESVDPGKFITAFLGVIDGDTGQMRYANAGHDPPILVKEDGTVEELTGGGLILGMLPQIVYEEARAEIPAASLVAIFTDGITEARDHRGEFFGSERLIEILKEARGLPCSQAIERVVEAAQDFGGDAPQADDITMILVRRR